MIKKNIVMVGFMVALFISCDPQPCEIDYYYLEPVRKKLYVDFPDTTFYNQSLLLNNIYLDSVTVKETVSINDSMFVIDKKIAVYTCDMIISEKKYKLRRSDTLLVGNPNSGEKFSMIRLSCDTIDFTQKSVNLSIWKSRYFQDCTNWNE